MRNLLILPRQWWVGSRQSSPERRSLPFAGHSAGGRELVNINHSDLRATVSQLLSINWTTLGSPRLSLTPMPSRITLAITY
jgi:hypothetical protein